MATRKTKKITEAVVERGSHSTRTVHPDGRIEFETHWDELQRDVKKALEDFEKNKKPAKITTSRTKKTKS